MDLNTSFFRSDNNENPASTPGTSKPLYAGAPKDLTEYTANVLLFKYFLKHTLTATAFQELLYLLSAFLPANAKIPNTVKELQKYFVQMHAEQKPNMQDYCSNCLGLLEEGKSPCECGTKKCQFVTVPLGPQIKARLESESFWGGEASNYTDLWLYLHYYHRSCCVESSSGQAYC